MQGTNKTIYNSWFFCPFTHKRKIHMINWRRQWRPTPVLLPGESQGRVEPGGLPSMGSHRVGQDWSDLAAVHDQLNKYAYLVWKGINFLFWTLFLRLFLKKDSFIWLHWVSVLARGIFHCGTWASQHMGSQLSDQGSNSYPLHCKGNSYPPDYQGKSLDPLT